MLITLYIVGYMVIGIVVAVAAYIMNGVGRYGDDADIIWGRAGCVLLWPLLLVVGGIWLTFKGSGRLIEALGDWVEGRIALREEQKNEDHRG